MQCLDVCTVSCILFFSFCCCSLVSSVIYNVILFVNTIWCWQTLIEKTWFCEAFQHNVYRHKLYRNVKIRSQKITYSITSFFLGLQKTTYNSTRFILIGHVWFNLEIISDGRVHFWAFSEKKSTKSQIIRLWFYLGRHVSMGISQVWSKDNFPFGIQWNTSHMLSQNAVCSFNLLWLVEHSIIVVAVLVSVWLFLKAVSKLQHSRGAAMLHKLSIKIKWTGTFLISC